MLRIATAALVNISAIVLFVYLIGYAGIPVWPIAINGDPLVSFDAEIGYVPRPNSASHRSDLPVRDEAPLNYSVFTDDRGARVEKPGTQHTSRVDMVTIGDSNAWGHGIEAEQTFSHVVGKQLDVPVLNLAFASWGTLHSLQMLERNMDLKPKLVVLEFITDHLRRNVVRCGATYYPFCIDQSYVDTQLRIRRPITNGVRRSLMHADSLGPADWFLHGVDVGLGRILTRVGNSAAGDVALQERAQAMLFDRLQKTVKAANAKLLVVYIPQTNFAPRPIVPPDIDLIDMTETYRAHAGSFLPYNSHISAEGHALAADAIADYWRKHID